MTRRSLKQLLSEPAYRTRLVFFLLLGTVVILLAIGIKNPFWSNLLLEFAVVFSAVALIQFMWDFLGGDPVELRIIDVQRETTCVGRSIEERLSDAMDELDTQLTSLKHSMTLLADLVDNNIGLERIWPDRKTWQQDPLDGLEVWQDRVCQATRAEIISNTWWNNWAHEEQFRRRFFANIARGGSARILLYDPESHVLRLRAADEEDPLGQMQGEIRATLLRLAQDRESLEESVRRNLEVRLTSKSMHFVQLIRADERMLLAIYLSRKSGGPSPTMQLRGPKANTRERNPTPIAPPCLTYPDIPI